MKPPTLDAPINKPDLELRHVRALLRLEPDNPGVTGRWITATPSLPETLRRAAVVGRVRKEKEREG